MRPEVVDSYIQYEPQKIENWRAEWFYVENHAHALPEWVLGPPKMTRDWFSSGQNKEQEDELLKKIALLKKEKVTSGSVVLSWIVRRIQPLQKRCSLGFEYSGLKDPSRFSGEKIKAEKAMKLVGVLLPSPLRDTPRW